jgi:hypothetical protein
MPVSDLIRASDLTRMANEGATIVVRNTQPGITTHTDELLKQTTEWTGAGDTSGGDVREVPAAYLKNPSFRDAIMRGIYVVEDGEESLMKAVESLRADWDGRQQAKLDSNETLKRSSNKSIGKGASCIAPKGTSLCGNISLVLGDEDNPKPPLCGEHAHMSTQYAQVPTGRLVNNKEEKTWRRGSVAAH